MKSISHIILHCGRTVVSWAKFSCEANGLNENDPGNLRNQLGDCLYLMRFGAVKVNKNAVIMSNQISSRDEFSRDELVEILCSKSNENFHSLSLRLGN